MSTLTNLPSSTICLSFSFLKPSSSSMYSATIFCNSRPDINSFHTFLGILTKLLTRSLHNATASANLPSEARHSGLHTGVQSTAVNLIVSEAVRWNFLLCTDHHYGNKARQCLAMQICEMLSVLPAQSAEAAK